MIDPLSPETDPAAGRRPSDTRRNPPGLTTLSYRGGRYARALQEMLALLPLESEPGAGAATALHPLAHLHTEIQSDWTVALIHAWAAATEVLGFYQERIVNEGFLRTAREPRSIAELAQTVGYRPRPGVAATATLAFTVQPGREEPVPIAAGLAVQSVPAPGEMPQIFETSEALLARAECNALRVAHPVAQAWNGLGSLRLQGTYPSLRPGAEVVLAGIAPATAGAHPWWYRATIETASPVLERNLTVATIAGMPPGAPAKPLPRPGLSLLGPGRKLFTYTPSGLSSAADPKSAWAPQGLGLPKVPVRALLATAGDGPLFAATEHGLFRSLDAAQTWHEVEPSFASSAFHSLFEEPDGALLAGSEEGKVYRSLDRGETWVGLGGEVLLLPPVGLARLWTARPQLLPKGAVRAVAAYRRGSAHYVVAGTDTGVFRSADGGETWSPANDDLPGTHGGIGSIPVRGFAIIGPKDREKLYAATDAGVFRIREGFKMWQVLLVLVLACVLRAALPGVSATRWLISHEPKVPAKTSGTVELRPAPQKIPTRREKINDWFDRYAFYPDALLGALLLLLLALALRWLARLLRRRPEVCLGKPVRCLVASGDGRFFAGTSDGLFSSVETPRDPFRWTDLDRRWEPVHGGIDQSAIVALHLSAANPREWLAATATGGVFRSVEGSDSWEQFCAVTLKSLLTAVSFRGRYLVGGAPGPAPLEDDWFPFQAAAGTVDLELLCPEILAGQWLVLRDAAGQNAGRYLVEEVAVAQSLDPLKPGTFTRLTVAPPPELARYARSGTLLLTEEKPIALLADDFFDPPQILIDEYVPILAPRKKILVTGQRWRIVLPDPALTAQEPFHLLGLETIPGANPLWRVMDHRGALTTVSCPREQICLLPAEKGDETVSETAEIASAERVPCPGRAQGRMLLSFTAPLQNLYDVGTVQILGNVVEATHGRTVAKERLGVSEGLKSLHEFTLKQSPLTYTSSITGQGVVSSLRIEVGGVSWSEGPPPTRGSETERKFFVRQTAAGTSEVTFVAGTVGSGLPRGMDEILATYRQGLGRVGNVRADSLQLLQSIPPGVKRVTNPLAAAGGEDAEPTESVRENAPSSLRCLGGVVSLSDYEDFANRFAGVGRARGRLLQKGGRQLVHLTVSGSGGEARTVDPELPRRLRAAILSSRSPFGPPVQVASFRCVYFDLKAKVWISPEFAPSRKRIERALIDALLAEFTPANRDFGQPVTAAEIVKLMHAIPGVAACQVQKLARHGEAVPAAAEKPTALATIAPTWGEGLVPGEEVLALRAQADIDLEIEVLA